MSIYIPSVNRNFEVVFSTETINDKVWFRYDFMIDPKDFKPKYKKNEPFISILIDEKLEGIENINNVNGRNSGDVTVFNFSVVRAYSVERDKENKNLFKIRLANKPSDKRDPEKLFYIGAINIEGVMDVIPKKPSNYKIYNASLVYGVNDKCESTKALYLAAEIETVLRVDDYTIDYESPFLVTASIYNRFLPFGVVDIDDTVETEAIKLADSVLSTSKYKHIKKRRLFFLD